VIIDEATQALEAVREYFKSSSRLCRDVLLGLLDSDIQSQEADSCW
jgi:hypothetical protein